MQARWDESGIPEGYRSQGDPALTAVQSSENEVPKVVAGKSFRGPPELANKLFIDSAPMHNSGPSLFQGAQNFAIHGGSFTMINQQACPAMDCEHCIIDADSEGNCPRRGRTP